MSILKIIPAFLCSFLFGVNSAYALSGDTELSCEALLCLHGYAVGNVPSECHRSLNRYFSIHHKKFYKTVRDRKAFLKLCPTGGKVDDARIDNLMNAIDLSQQKQDLEAQLSKVEQSLEKVETSIITAERKYLTEDQYNNPFVQMRKHEIFWDEERQLHYIQRTPDIYKYNEDSGTEELTYYGKLLEQRNYLQNRKNRLKSSIASIGKTLDSLTVDFWIDDSSISNTDELKK